MFKKSKEKIVASIMIFLILVLSGTIGIIYATTFHSIYRDDQRLLEHFTQEYIEGWRPSQVHKDKQHESIQATVFYGVVFNLDGLVNKVVNNLNPIMEDERLIEVANQFVESGKDEGISGNLVYRVTRAETQIYVFLMNNTTKKDSMIALITNTTILGCMAIAILFVISLKIADEIVGPLEEGYKKQKQFICDAGHELKTPISTIYANTEMLEREIGKNRWLANIQFENKRMEELVQQLLELARTENMTPVLELVNISRIVIGGMLPFESIAFEKGYIMNSRIEEEIYIKGDPKQLGQLVAILIDNALTHAEGKGSISVMLKLESNTVVFEVSNPGKEIPAQEREKIFDRFYRMDPSRNLNGHYGLGLAIAKSIVTSHNGKISVKCKNETTTFTVILPQKK